MRVGTGRAFSRHIIPVKLEITASIKPECDTIAIFFEEESCGGCSRFVPGAILDGDSVKEAFLAFTFSKVVEAEADFVVIVATVFTAVVQYGYERLGGCFT